jgi:5-methylcytosine-specific restriction endonuclease McrA
MPALPIYNAKRRRRIASALIVRANGLCCLCGWPLCEPPVDGLDPVDWEPSVEHLRPRSLGGRHDFKNLDVSHVICNTERGRSDFARLRQIERLAEESLKGA